MPITREQLRAQLTRREMAPVYVLFGAETRLRDIAADTIARLCFDEGDLRDFNESFFSLNQAGNLRSALSAAYQLPMMASRRVVRITDVRISATGYRDTITEDDLDTLEKYFAEPSPSSVVLFIADDLNGVRKAGKLLRERATAVEFASLDRDQFEARALELIKNAGVTMDAPCLRLLLSRVGPDVRRLSNEVNKLAAAALPDTVITSDLIEALVANSRELSNFDLTDHLVAGRRTPALASLRKMLDDGAEPLALIGLLGANFRNLLSAKDLMQRDVDRREVVRRLRVPYPQQESILAIARRASVAQLTSALSNIAKADLAVKTSVGGVGPRSARMHVEKLVCELALI